MTCTRTGVVRPIRFLHVFFKANSRDVKREACGSIPVWLSLSPVDLAVETEYFIEG